MNRLTRMLAAALLVSVGFTMLAGCGSGAGQLEGTRWKLTGWSLSSLDPADFTITMSFADGQVSGGSGVNTYGGTCTIGPGDAFKVGEIASTMMAGEEPAMRAESAFMTLLREVSSYKVADGVLTLYDASGNESLIFQVATP